MTLTVANLIQNLESFAGRDLETVFQKKPFSILFHDTVKLRIRTQHRDLSIPLSILLLGIAQLLAKREFSRTMCVELLGKEWGYNYVARLLLECDDVCLQAGSRDMALTRIRLSKNKLTPVKVPPNGNRAVNPDPKVV